MTLKNSVAGLVVLLLFLGFGCRAAKEPYHSSKTAGPTNEVMDKEEPTTHTVENKQSDEEEVSHTVIVFYFHPTFRCQACLDIEALSQEAIKNGFGKAIKNGDLIWLVLNFEEPDAKEFADEFSIDASTLVIADMEDGQLAPWKKLEKVWELLDDRDSFVKYVQEEVAAYLGNN